MTTSVGGGGDGVDVGDGEEPIREISIPIVAACSLDTNMHVLMYMHVHQIVRACIHVPSLQLLVTHAHVSRCTFALSYVISCTLFLNRSTSLHLFSYFRITCSHVVSARSRNVRSSCDCCCAAEASSRAVSRSETSIPVTGMCMCMCMCVCMNNDIMQHRWHTG